MLSRVRRMRMRVSMLDPANGRALPQTHVILSEAKNVAFRHPEPSEEPGCLGVKLFASLRMTIKRRIKAPTD